MARSVVAAAADATRARSVQCHAAATRELELERLLIEERVEAVFTQALAAACTAFCARVVELGRCGSGSGSSSQNVLGMTGSRPDHRPSASAADGSALVLERFAHIGMLLHVESLLSTMNNEMGMIGDMRAAVQQLRRVRFRVQCGAPTPTPMSAAMPSQSPSRVGCGAVSAESGCAAAAASSGSAGVGGAGAALMCDTDEALLSNMHIFIEDESAWPFFRAHPAIAPPPPTPTPPPPPPPKHDLLSLNPPDISAAAIASTAVAAARVPVESVISTHRRAISALVTEAAFTEHFGAPVARTAPNTDLILRPRMDDITKITQEVEAVPVVAAPVKSTRPRRAMTAQDAEAAFAEHFCAPVVRATPNLIVSPEAAVCASAASATVSSPVRGAMHRARSSMGSVELDSVFEEHFGAPVESSNLSGRDLSISSLPDSPSASASCVVMPPTVLNIANSSDAVSSPKMTPLRRLLSRQAIDGRDNTSRKESHDEFNPDGESANIAAMGLEAAEEILVAPPRQLAAPTVVSIADRRRSQMPRELSVPAPAANAGSTASSASLPTTSPRSVQPRSGRTLPSPARPRFQTQRHLLCGGAVAAALPMSELPLLSHHQVESPAQPRQPSNPSSLSAPDASAESVDYARPLILNVLVPPELFACLPPGFTFADDGDADADQAGSAVEAGQSSFNSGAASAKSDMPSRRNEVALVPVLFTQGVNEMQSGMVFAQSVPDSSDSQPPIDHDSFNDSCKQAQLLFA